MQYIIKMVVIATKYDNISVWIYPGSFFPPQTFTNASDRNSFKCLPSEYKYEQLGPGSEPFLLFSPLLCISIWLVCLSAFGPFVLLVCRCINFNEIKALWYEQNIWRQHRAVVKRQCQCLGCVDPISRPLTSEKSLISVLSICPSPVFLSSLVLLIMFSTIVFVPTFCYTLFHCLAFSCHAQFRSFNPKGYI